MTTVDAGEQGLDWTGERYMPGMPGNIEFEHLHRYLLARELVEGRRVLDIACGEGYGSDLLATIAADVVGVDVLPEVLRHACRRYRRPNLRFLTGQCAAIPLADRSMDVVVSFETLEHVDEHDEMMREVKRVLLPGGLLVISSPDRREYSDLPAYRNPFHVRELYRHEFEKLLTSHFQFVSVVGQRVRAGSIIGPLERAAECAFLSFAGPDRANERCEGLEAPLYLIAVASDSPLPRIPTGFLNGGDFVWSQEHTEAVRRLVDEHRAEVEQLARAKDDQDIATGALRAELERQTALLSSLAAEMARAEEGRVFLEKEHEQRGHRIGELDVEVARLQESCTEAHRALEQARTQVQVALEQARTEVQMAHESSRTRETQLIKERDGIRSAMEVIENSHSWRLTAPLRELRRRMEALFRLSATR